MLFISILIEGDQHSVPFESESIRLIRKEYPNALVSEFDNYSESYIVEQNLVLIKEEKEKVVLVFQVKDSTGSNVTGFLNKCLRLKKDKDFSVLFRGVNNKMEGVLKKIASQFFRFKDPEELKEVLKSL